MTPIFTQKLAFRIKAKSSVLHNFWLTQSILVFFFEHQTLNYQQSFDNFFGMKLIFLVKIWAGSFGYFHKWPSHNWRQAINLIQSTPVFLTNKMKYLLSNSFNFVPVFWKMKFKLQVNFLISFYHSRNKSKQRSAPVYLDTSWNNCLAIDVKPSIWSNLLPFFWRIKWNIFCLIPSISIRFFEK